MITIIFGNNLHKVSLRFRQLQTSLTTSRKQASEVIPHPTSTRPVAETAGTEDNPGVMGGC